MSTRKQVSLAEARSHLADLIEESRSGPVELTRRGEAVALLVSIEDFRRRPSLWDAIEALRTEVGEEGLFDENPYAKRLL